MINSARLIQCLPWQCLDGSSIEPDRELITNSLIEWLSSAPIAADGTVTRLRSSEQVASLKDAQKALRKLQRDLLAAKLLDHDLPIFDSSAERSDFRSLLPSYDLGGNHRRPTYKDLIHSMTLDLDGKSPAPHPAAKDEPEQWQRFVMRGLFWNLWSNGLVDWRGIGPTDQAKFLSSIMLEVGTSKSLAASPWSAERWRKSLNDFFVKNESGDYYLP